MFFDVTEQPIYRLKRIWKAASTSKTNLSFFRYMDEYVLTNPQATASFRD